MSNLERIQKFINQLKVVQDISTEALLREVSQLNLKQFLPEVSKAVAQGKLTTKDYHQTVEICVKLHERYESFASMLLPDIVK